MRALVASLFACLLCFTVDAHAATYVFTGRIDQTNPDFAVGTKITGSFGYDDNLSPYFEVPDNGGIVYFYGGGSVFEQVNIAGTSYSGQGMAYTYVGSKGQGVALTVFGNDTAMTTDVTLGLTFMDPTSSTLTGIALPTGAPFPALTQAVFPKQFEQDTDGLTVPYAYLTFQNETNNTQFNASVLSITPAPEPATWVCLTLGFAFVGAALRRRRLPLLPPALA